MTKVQVSEVRDNLADVINRTAYGNERLIIERRGKPLAALVTIEDMELLDKLEDHIDLLDAMEALAEAEKGGTVPWQEFKESLEQKTP